MSDMDQQEQVNRSLENLEALMATTPQKALERTLQRLGIDTRNPLSAQQDFARLRTMRKLMEDEDFLADIRFMRRWRLNSEKITDTGLYEPAAPTC